MNNQKIQIIAEAGVNHNGNVKIAKEMVHAAGRCGVDIVKFQTFDASSLVSVNAGKAEYQKQTTDAGQSQLEMLRQLQLSEDDFQLLAAECGNAGIYFLSTPFDLKSINFLNQYSMPFWKVPSGEVTNFPYLAAIGRTKKAVVLSTGMCTLKEVGTAVDTLMKYGTPTITLLQCNTEYPTPYEDVNLNAMLTLKREFGFPVGYSDHTQGIEVPIAAAALGATVIEKHFTLSRNMEGPDHKASLEPHEMAAMVTAIRHIEAAMGDGEKKPSQSEQKNIAVARKSIVAAKPIQKGKLFTESNITTKRPGTGVSPMRWLEVLGTPAKRDFSEDELIEL